MSMYRAACKAAPGVLRAAAHVLTTCNHTHAGEKNKDSAGDSALLQVPVFDCKASIAVGVPTVKRFLQYFLKNLKYNAVSSMFFAAVGSCFFAI